jgi:antitoxin VapB
MGISIKREETERLARDLARLTGESLTDAIHHALEHELARLGHARKSAEARQADLDAYLARIDARGPGNGKTLSEIEADMYGPFGEPV